MMSTNAFFVKDVIGPNGCASICAKEAASDKASDDIDSHTKTNMLRFHSAKTSADGSFAAEDEWISTKEEPVHDELCAREQLFLYNAIVNDVDLTRHIDDAVNSLRICLAADESARTGKVVEL